MFLHFNNNRFNIKQWRKKNYNKIRLHKARFCWYLHSSYTDKKLKRKSASKVHKQNKKQQTKRWHLFAFSVRYSALCARYNHGWFFFCFHAVLLFIIVRKPIQTHLQLYSDAFPSKQEQHFHFNSNFFLPLYFVGESFFYQMHWSGCWLLSGYCVSV